MDKLPEILKHLQAIQDIIDKYDVMDDLWWFEITTLRNEVLKEMTKNGQICPK